MAEAAAAVPAEAAAAVPAAERALIDAWIARAGLNDYGDARDTCYVGGTPLFDETTGQSVDRYAYLVAKFPARPWAA